MIYYSFYLINSSNNPTKQSPISNIQYYPSKCLIFYKPDLSANSEFLGKQTHQNSRHAEAVLQTFSAPHGTYKAFQSAKFYLALKHMAG
jgi:hypothetical protein